MKEYFEKHQQIAYQTLINCKKNNKFPHAILLNGYKDTPLMDIAKYFAKAIICDNELPCEECISCLKIDDENYPDLIIVDGANTTIKKDDIENIQERFSLSALEEKGIKIYIINQIENATSESVNSLLKFLEEPTSNIYAILTTANINNVLPTIISRCMNIRLKKISKDELVNEAIQKDIAKEDALILASFCGNIESLIETYNNSSYITLKDYVIDLLNKIKSKEDLLYFAQTEISNSIKDKNDFLLFLELLETALLDVLHYKTSNNINYIDNENIISFLSNEDLNIENKLSTIMLFKGCTSLNANVKLLLDNLIIKLERN